MTTPIRAVDLFCGAGGTSSGLIDAAQRLGRPVDLLAINHWSVAIATHQANLPGARHLCAEAENVSPKSVVPSGRLELLVASPECTHFSTARGGRPINDQKRADPWQVIRWAEALRIDNVLIENVPEFRSWGPLDGRQRPIKRRKGEKYRVFLDALRACGYTVEDRVLNAADYGDPTTRRRLFIIARRARPVRWPEPTHAPAGSLLPGRKPWRAAREIIDWSLEGQSIFGRKRPLSKNTMARILAGLQRFGGPEVGPFLVVLRGTDPDRLKRSARSLDLPLPVVCSGHGGFGLAEPFLLGQQSGAAARPVSEPAPPVATRGAIALVEPFLLPPLGVHARNGKANKPRSLDDPLQTITASRGGGHLVQALIAKYYGTGGCKLVSAPLDTVTTKPRFGLVTFEREGLALDIRFRMLRPHELARAQSLGDFTFSGTVEDQVRQIGNAVPRRLATALCLAALS